MRTVVLVLVLAILAVPFSADAQHPGKWPRVGFLLRISPSAAAPHLQAFQQGLRQLGWVEGQNIHIEYRFASSDEQFRELAAELVRLKVDVIVTWGTPAGLAAKHATSDIPIVSFGGDPIRAGLVASLARPGGNITGIATTGPDLAGKQLQLLREMVPRISRVLVIWNPANPVTALVWQETRRASQVLGLKLDPFPVTTAKELLGVLDGKIAGPADALAALHDVSLVFDHRTPIAEFALRRRLPSVFQLKEYVEAGGLLSYGMNFPDLWRRMATYVDKILKGSKPADLPVEQPTNFELVINLRTAKALGLTIPPSVLVRTDQVIE